MAFWVARRKVYRIATIPLIIPKMKKPDPWEKTSLKFEDVDWADMTALAQEKARIENQGKKMM